MRVFLWAVILVASLLGYLDTSCVQPKQMEGAAVSVQSHKNAELDKDASVKFVLGKSEELQHGAATFFLVILIATAGLGLWSWVSGLRKADKANSENQP